MRGCWRRGRLGAVAGWAGLEGIWGFLAYRVAFSCETQGRINRGLSTRRVLGGRLTNGQTAACRRRLATAANPLSVQNGFEFKIHWPGSDTIPAAEFWLTFFSGHSRPASSMFEGERPVCLSAYFLQQVVASASREQGSGARNIHSKLARFV